MLGLSNMDETNHERFKTMKIIEVLKELPLIDRKISKIVGHIHTYSSEVMEGQNHEFTFGTAEEQRKHVDSLIQSGNDLVARRAKLRRALAITNAEVEVTIGGMTKSISEWIDYRERGMQDMLNVVSSLSVQNAQSVLRGTGNQTFDASEGIKIVRFYDEAQRNERYNELAEIQGKIDAQLEMVNATTDLTVEV